jgi:hypothetical protein
MIPLIVASLAVFAVWEYLIMVLPVSIPAWLQPALVAGFAVGASAVPPAVLRVLAVTGAVALCHALVTKPTLHDVRRPLRGRVPRL